MSTPQDPANSPSGTGKKVHFVSLGCPKNLVDSEIILGHMVREHAKGEKLNLVAVISERSCIAGIVMATVAKPRGAEWL